MSGGSGFARTTPSFSAASQYCTGTGALEAVAEALGATLRVGRGFGRLYRADGGGGDAVVPCHRIERDRAAEMAAAFRVRRMIGEVPAPFEFDRASMGGGGGDGAQDHAAVGPRTHGRWGRGIGLARMVERRGAGAVGAGIVGGVEQIIGAASLHQPRRFEEAGRAGDDMLGPLGGDHVRRQLHRAQPAEGAPIDIDAAVIVDQDGGIDILDVVGDRRLLRDDWAGGMRIAPGAGRPIGNRHTDREAILGLAPALMLQDRSIEIEAAVASLDHLPGIGTARFGPGENGLGPGDGGVVLPSPAGGVVGRQQLPLVHDEVVDAVRGFVAARQNPERIAIDQRRGVGRIEVTIAEGRIATAMDRLGRRRRGTGEQDQQGQDGVTPPPAAMGRRAE